MNARCDNCGGWNASQCERLDSNLRPHRRRLCKPCGRKLGYTVLDYRRVERTAKFV